MPGQTKFRTYPSGSEIKEAAIRLAVVEDWDSAKVFSRLMKEQMITTQQGKAVVTWLFKPLNGFGRKIPMGDDIRSKREAIPATIGEVAKKAGLNYSTVSKFEKSEVIPNEKTVEAITRALTSLARRGPRKKYNDKIAARKREEKRAKEEEERERLSKLYEGREG